MVESKKLRVFDPKAPYSVVVGRLPHWSQAGTLCFITWRTWDSIPKLVLNAWLTDRDAWLRQHGIAPEANDWRSRLYEIEPKLVTEYDRRFTDRWFDHLDECHGECLLQRPKLARLVADALLHFDGERYELTDFVVMPNHVHILASFRDETTMLKQCESWKHFTARQINLILGRRGRFWRQDDFDHLIRSHDQFLYFRRYIADNPAKARLKPGEYLHYSKPLIE